MQESPGAAAAGGKQVRPRSLSPKSIRGVCGVEKIQRLLGKGKGGFLGHVC